LEFSKADRGGRIFVDVGRNGYSATFAAAYAVRARPGAPVSAPCTWAEVERGEVGPQTFTLRTMGARVEAVGDLWADMPRRKRPLARAIERLRDLQERFARRGPLPSGPDEAPPPKSRPRGGRSGRAREM